MNAHVGQVVWKERLSKWLLSFTNREEDVDLYKFIALPFQV